ncbi:unnamed protein product (macronuclear) [Paramecium tetraurelia]|uniref:Poly [ADP-ribose] polymerase n=1 Tax=Paramecium tetraurelia TaxID=5888 RepID=A0BYL4_PARTE|nr:uncharacterized protein GSPATT00033484001 [Paramecium tetraurelia]CAK63631.1 unnamed protein product [Paramecium tetraurelia]|eukprot:XP_001431029.1 hypothetical protein (macronuclear) [Paramecium tetraurelia strain d4-2]
MKTRGQKTEPNYAYQFKKDQILGQSEKGKPVFYKVVEDLKTNDHKSQLKVVRLEQQEKQKDGKVVYKESQEALLSVKERTQEKILFFSKIVEDVEVKSTKPNPRSKSTVTSFVFQQDTLQDIAKSVKQIPANTKQQKKQVSSESESEEEEPPKKQTIKKGTKQAVKEQTQKKEVQKITKKKVESEDSAEEEESSEEQPPKKQVTTKKQAQKVVKTNKKPTKQVKQQESEQSSDEESEQEQKKKRATRQAPSGKKAQPEVPPVQKKQIKRGRAQKKEESDESEEEFEENEVQSQSVEEKKKKGKAGAKKSKSQPAQPKKFMRGKANPNYREIRQTSEQLEGTSSKFVDHSSIMMNNKELIRAAQTDDIFAHSLKISNLFQRWAPENDANAIELIFKRQDKAMLLKFLKAMEKVKLGTTPRCSLKEIQTGYNDQYAYGSRTRKVALGRGGREGNNAFVYDLDQEDTLTEDQIERLLKIETNPEFFGLMIAQLGEEHQYYDQIALAVRSGNWKTAGYLVQMAMDKGHMYGFNQVHVDVLNYTSASRIGNIKKPSATKKSGGTYLVTPIHCAAINPNHACLQKLLEISQEYNILDDFHRKPVHYAAVAQTSACLKFLMDNSIDVREGDRNKSTPLILAAQYGRTHNVELLASNNIDGKNRDGNAAIHAACLGGHLETVKVLLKNGAKINLTGQNRMTPLNIACAYGHYELAKYLIEQGAKVLAKDKYGRTSCVLAARNGNVKILSLLLYHGAEYDQPDSSKNTPLHYAAAYGFPECIEELMKAGADQNLPNSWKLTPLSVALQKNHLGIVKKLLSYPTTDVNCKDDEGRTLISSSLSKFTVDSFEYMKYLILEKNADVKIADLQEKTPLHYAVLLSRKEAKQFYPKWNEMSKAERRVIKNKYEELVHEMIELLINAGSDVNVQDNNGQTPFIQSLISQNFKVSELLLKLSTPSVNYVDKKDRNILHKLIECRLFQSEKGFSILQNIIKTVDPTFVNQYDENGWNPILYLFSEFTSTAEQQYSKIYEKKVSVLLQKLFEEKQKILVEEEEKINQEKKLKNNDQKDGKKNLQDEEENEEDEDEEGEGGEEDENEEGSDKDELEVEESQKMKMKLRMKMKMKIKIILMKMIIILKKQEMDYLDPLIFFLNLKQMLQKLRINTTLKHFIIKISQLQSFQSKIKLMFWSMSLNKNVWLYKRQQLSYINCSLIQEQTLIHQSQRESNLENKKRTNKRIQIILILMREVILQLILFSSLIIALSFTEAAQQNIYPIHLFANSCNMNQVCGRENENSQTFLEYVISKIDVTVKDEELNTPTSQIACRYNYTLDGILDILISNGGSVNNLNEEDVVPIQNWVRQGNVKVVGIFLTKFKADPNFPDKSKRTALHHAINSSNSEADASFEMEHLLIKNGANTNALDIYKRTPLFYAFTKMTYDNDFREIDPFETVSSVLADKHCSVDTVDIHQRSPLHYAAMRGSVISGRYMIKMKAPIDVPDKYGNTPLALAFLCGHSNFCTMLIDNKADVNRYATVVDYEKIRREERKKIKERIERGEAIEQEDEFASDEEEEENEDQGQGEEEDDNGLYGGARTKQTARKSYGGKAPIKRMAAVAARPYYGNHQQGKTQKRVKVYLLQSTKFPVGTYSYFKLAIKQGWQGLAYLLISDGYDLQRAIEDAIMEEQFKLVRTLLMKVKDDEIVQKQNKNKQNLFHIFSIKGRQCTDEISLMIADELASRQVDRNAKDDQNNTPLHYAAQNDFFGMIQYLLQSDSDPNCYNNDQNTPFSIRLQEKYKALVSDVELQHWKDKKTNLNVKFKVKGKDYQITPILYLIQEYHLEDVIILNKFTDAGCDINEKTENGETSLMLAIKINSLKLVNYILNHPQFKVALHAQDSQNRTPIHYVVQPLEFGSYENIEMLQILSKQFDINQADKLGRTPLDYANDQDSGTMAEVLKKLNAKEGKKQKQPRLPTSVISQAQWVEEEIDVEADAQKFLDQNGEQLDDSKQDTRKIVDSRATSSGKVEVWIDKESGPYSLQMTKVDIGNGIYSENVFYKMQLLHEINRNVFILFTRWGRIGTGGQHQLTPFENAEEAIKEFNKIFHSKTGGNDWKKVSSGEEPFEKKPGKYQLINFKNVKNYKTLLNPFDFSKKSPYQQCNLEKAIRRFMLQFVQVKLYNKDLQQFHIDLDSMPIERLDRKQLEAAKAILNELTDCVEDLQKLRQTGDLDIKKIQNIFNEICDKSSRFYEFIPNLFPPLDSVEAINQKLLLIETLLNFEITSKILLGAHLVKQTINPLTYCFNALNVRVVTLPKEHPEFKLIVQYINQSQQAKVSNIFAVERRGEAERFEHNKQHNRMLLWHGSKISNFMGILAQGLRVAPPWAFNTGTMFGKGIYFADMFQKSFGYTEDWSLYYNTYNGLFQQNGYYDRSNNAKKDEQDEIQRYRYMLLCEVAVGKTLNQYNPEYITNLDKQYQSVKGCGRRGPDYNQSVILSNGCKVPVGQCIDYPQPKKKDKEGNPVRFQLQHNEYIVYDETKVKVRYMVQLDTKDTIDEY